MTEKELKKYSRKELIKLILSLEEKLTETETELDKRKINLKEAGSIAEASLKINGVFEAAQKAADQYVENILSKDINAREIELKAKNKAEEIIKEAEIKANKINEEAKNEKEKIIKEAKEKYLKEFDPEECGIIWS